MVVTSDSLRISPRQALTHRKSWYHDYCFVTLAGVRMTGGTWMHRQLFTSMLTKLGNALPNEREGRDLRSSYDCDPEANS